MLGHTNCKIILVSAAYAHEVAGLEHELEDLEHIFVRDDSYETWLAAQSAEDPNLPITPDDLFYHSAHPAAPRVFPRVSHTPTKPG